MRLPLIVLAAACAAAPTVAVCAPSSKSPSAAPDPSFRRQAALPKWALALGEIPSTKRIDPVVVRLTETQVWVGPTPAVLYNRAIQVNDSSALGTIGQFALDYFAAYQKLLLHRVVVIRDGRMIDHTHTVNARALQRETAIDSGMLGGATSMQLLLEDVRIGDTLWVTYTVEGENPVLGKLWSGDFAWGSSAPVELRLLTVLHPVTRALHWRQLGDFRTDLILPKIERVGDIERLRFEGRAIEAVEGEPSIPSDFLPGRMLQFSEYRDWHEVATWVEGLFPKNKPSPALATLAQQFAKEADPASRAAAALRWVQQEVRYFSVSIGENSHRPQTPDVVLKRRYGDCKDKSYLLISLLSELGIEARPVLLSATAPKLPARVLASPLWFNHVVVQIRIDGRDYYVDPTSARQPEPLALIPGVAPGGAALVVERGATALITLPPRGDTLPHHELVQHIAVTDFDGAATMETQNIFRGSYADHARTRYPIMSVTEQKKTMLASYEKRYPGIALIDAPVLLDFPADNRYEIRTRYRMPKAVSLQEKMHGIDYDPHLIDETLGIPDKIVRNFPLELAAGKYRGRYRLTLTWPKEVRAALDPITSTVDNPYFRAHEEYTFRGNVVSYLMDYRIKTASVAAAEMPAFQAQAKLLIQFGGGRFKVSEAFVTSPEAMRYSSRELDSLRSARELIDTTADMTAMKDGKVDNEQACRFVGLSAGLEDLIGSDVVRQARRLEKAVAAQSSQAGARACLARLAFSRGQFADSARLYRAEAATLKGDSQDARNLAWASMYAGDSEAAVNAMARYRAARAGSQDGLASNTGLADHIALLQRAGKPVPQDLLLSAAEISDGPWPRPVLAMQAGLITPAALVQAAEALPGDARAFALTEAWFYSAQWHLARKDIGAARSALQSIASAGIQSSELYAQGLNELGRLAPNDAQFKAGAIAYKEKGAGAARAKWEKGAAAGDPNAQFALGLLAYRGDSEPKDVKRALAQFELASAQGHARAHYMLGGMYEFGEGVAITPERSFKHYLASAESGDVEAQVATGYSYRTGHGVAIDREKSVFWFSRAVQRGSAAGLDEMGRSYQFGWGVPVELDTSLRLYRAAAQTGYAPAQAHVGWMYYEGNGIPVDAREAVTWFRKAAAQNSRDGQYGLGWALMEGKGVTRNYADGRAALRKAADQGLDQAMVSYGFAFAEGQGVAIDHQQAHAWYLKAAAMNNSTAQFNLGANYHSGRGVKEDSTEAMKWFEKSAVNGDVDAASSLGKAYRNGDGVPRDAQQAAKWLGSAVDRGDTRARVQLAQMLAGGEGLPKDEAKAFALFELAAAAGNHEGQYELGKAYEKGIGVTKDAVKAAAAYTLAAAGKSGKSGKSGNAATRLRIMAAEDRLPGPEGYQRRQASARAEAAFDISDLVGLGDAYAAHDELAQAQATYERALRLAQSAPKPDHKATLDALESLGYLLRRQIRFAEAEPVHRRILTLTEKGNGSGARRCRRCTGQR